MGRWDSAEGALSARFTAEQGVGQAKAETVASEEELGIFKQEGCEGITGVRRLKEGEMEAHDVLPVGACTSGWEALEDE